MEQFVKLDQNQPRKGQPSHTTSTSLLAQKGTFFIALSGTIEKFEPWVIDSGAMDHITSSAHLFF